MLNYILRRLLQLPLVLLGISFLIFAVMQFLPPAVRASAYIQNDKQMGALPALIQQYGLDRDVFTQYFAWLGQVFRGNLGWSGSVSEPVLQAMQTRLPATIELALLTFVCTVILGVGLGLIAGARRGTWVDQAIRLYSVVTWTLPTFVLAIFILAYFYGKLRWWPPGRIDNLLAITEGIPSVNGFLLLPAILRGQWEVVGDLLRHLMGPVLTITIVACGGLVQIVRANVIEQVRQDYVRTARAKGLPETLILRKHVLRNVMIPVVTWIGGLLFGLLSGATIAETVFNYPGVGLWVTKAATVSDTAAVVGFALFSATVIAVVNLIVDLLYAVIDPRVSYS
ncbi:ABC transporter permease (plasmid) [Deinococcus metallilatus]|uniref:ABC transporter permease n=1 Tax=Deinococcus metallilatus TaxID=1211322 RepID=A0AAJ5K6U7_9DEIO|nr:ABC transporter permease [Deinococcus metallilatus]MBB5293526.1 peptide/nickel transport system permease protein [Deinococcus metallilatus]QBY06602.1 ABC transporter permease [Deinococcus metallilatus]RXJ17945.1 ABC transporter permease [Deinococcus metallilatus]TLK32216.1 ABC transporter permease [Deinococcus metallilatus]GMA15254.1 peptide ABC transporter permease [Deinococcus metallilatus]